MSHHTVRRRPSAGPVRAAQPRRRITVAILFLRQLLFTVAVHVVRLHHGRPRQTRGRGDHNGQVHKNGRIHLY